MSKLITRREALISLSSSLLVLACGGGGGTEGEGTVTTNPDNAASNPDPTTPGGLIPGGTTSNRSTSGSSSSGASTSSGTSSGALPSNSTSSSSSSSSTSGSSTSGGSTSSSSSSSGSSSSGSQIDTRLSAAIESMGQAHEAYPHGAIGSFGWPVLPQVVMGCYPHSDHLPRWWPGDRSKFLGPWTGILNWFVIYRAADSSGNYLGSSTNTGVRIGNMSLWLLSKATMSWIRIGPTAIPTWESSRTEASTGGITPENPTGGFTSSPTVKDRSKDGVLYLGPIGEMTHGGTPKFLIPLPWDGIAALVATADHRLERIDPSLPDDTNSAKFIVHCGADYYPNMTVRAQEVIPYLPGAALGRFLLATKQWRTSVVFAKANDVPEADILAAGWPG